jgi:CheY-like chemotaxis protein
MLRTAQENNYNLGISGLLVYGNNRFLQVIEGIKGPLESLYEKINKDERHSDLHLISEEEIEAPAFDLWRMLFINLDTIGRGRGGGTTLGEFHPEKMSPEAAFDFLSSIGNFLKSESEHFVDAQKKVAFCDDDPSALKLMELFLRDQPFELRTYLSATELLEDSEDFRPELIISDIDMPRMNGLELLKEVRKKDFYIPFIFATSRTLDDRIEGALSKGADGYMLKPYARNELLTGIRQGILSSALMRNSAIHW